MLRLAAIGLLGLIAAGEGLAQSKGDVFSSRGAPDDRRKYVSRDGRNFDRCAYDTDVPIDNAIMNQ